jgi:hypothetical protein
MKLETYNHQASLHQMKTKSRRINLFIFLTFILISSIILFQVSSQNGINFTGFSIFQENSNSTTEIKANLSVPKITFKEEFPEIKTTLEKGSSVILDGKTFSLAETERELVFKDFKGTVTFEGNKIYILKGKASEVTLSGVTMTKDKKIDVLLQSETSYRKIEMNKEVLIKSLDYISIGEILINQDLIKTNSERTVINDYFGKIHVENSTLFIEGKVSSIEIYGEGRKIKISS